MKISAQISYNVRGLLDFARVVNEGLHGARVVLVVRLHGAALVVARTSAACVSSRD